MRVLHVIPSVAARYGGPSAAVVGFCRALNARAVDTTIATTNADGEGVLPVSLGTPTTFEGLDAMFFARRGEAFKYSGALARWLRGHVAAYDAVHIHAVFSHASLAAGRACRSRGVPYILRPIGSLDPWSLAQKAWKKRVLLGASGRALIQGAAAIHFTTDDEARLAAPLTEGVRAVVVPPGVDEAYVLAPVVSPERRARRIVTMSRLDPKKRLSSLIRAFHRIASEPAFGAWHLTIAGDGNAPYRAELQQLASAGPASSRIDFPGWLDGDQKRGLLCGSALFALPSHQENFGIGLVEALACGLPAILSAAVNLSTAVRAAGAGWIVGPSAEGEDGEDRLEATLRLAMADDEGRATRALAARTLALQFRWDDAAANLEALYRSLRPTSARRLRSSVLG